MTPKISIIVPAFNEEKFIARCLDSILNQTFNDFEVLCIDDGSTDSTFDIITKYAQADSRIVPLKNTGKGVSSARNLGLDNAKGEYIGFVDSDDFIQPQMYEFLFRAIIENNADMAVCNYTRTSEVNSIFFDYVAEICTIKNLLNYKNEFSIYCVPLKLINKKIIKEKFYDYKIGEDSVFSSYLWINSKHTIFVNLPLYNYFINDNSVTQKNYSDKVWLDSIQTTFIIYSIFQKYNFDKDIYLKYLEDGIKLYLNYRMFSKDNSKESKKFFKKFFNEYKKYSEFSLIKKLYFLFSYHFPIIYEFRRKLLDKTLR